MTVFWMVAGITSVSAQELLVGFGSHNAEPYAFIEDGQLVGGIIKDVMDAVGNEAGIPVIYRDTPRKRIGISLLERRVHVIPIGNPAWGHDDPQLDWSIPLFQEVNRFVVSQTNVFAIQTFDDLKGKRVGTILGYYYPGLMDFFERRAIVRDDVPTLEQNFKKLAAGRIDALVDSNILIGYYLQTHDAHDQFVLAEKVVSSHDIQARVSKQSPVSVEQLNTVFQRLKSSGRMAEILERYQ